MIIKKGKQWFFFYIGESLFPLTFLFSVCLQTPVGSKNRFYSGFPQIESCPSWRCSSVPSGNRCYWIWVCRQRCCFDAGPITASVLRRRRSLGWCGGGRLKGSERQWRGYCRVCRALASIQRSWRTFWTFLRNAERRISNEEKDWNLKYNIREKYTFLHLCSSFEVFSGYKSEKSNLEQTEAAKD